MRKIKFTCIVDSVYTLSLYLLYQSYENIMATQFFVGSTISDEVCSHLLDCVKISTKAGDYDSAKKMKRLRWRCLRYIPRILNTKIYAQDHIRFAPQLILYSKYTLLEDAPGVFTMADDVNHHFCATVVSPDLKTRIWQKIYVGNICNHHFGENSQCINRIITEEKDVVTKFIKGKKYELVNLTQLWNRSGEWKRGYIEEVLGITPDLLRIVSSADTLYLTQPLMEDCGLSEKELEEIINPYYEKYKSNGFVLKPHPRDKFDYKKHFPEAQVFQTLVPMQLLSIMGVKFKRAITMFSTAVSLLPPDTEVIWIGTKVNDKIYAMYGNVEYKSKEMPLLDVVK